MADLGGLNLDGITVVEGSLEDIDDVGAKVLRAIANSRVEEHHFDLPFYESIDEGVSLD